MSGTPADRADGQPAGVEAHAAGDAADAESRRLASAAAARPAVLVFRKRLLPWSETFIAAQGGALERYRPVYTGYRRLPAGERYLAGRELLPLEHHALVPWLAKGLFKATRRVPRRWLRALAATEPTLLHAHFGGDGDAASPIARALGIPLVVTFHGMDIAPRATRSRRRWRARVFAAATRVIAVSQFIAERLREAGCPPEKIVVHYIGVDTAAFEPPSPGGRHRARVLFVGRLVAKKGLVHLIRAMPAVRREVPAAELVVAGDGPLRAELEAEAARLGVACDFLGVQTPEQVRQLMRGAAVLCSPSVVAPNGNTEALGIVNLEAQASGLPVVAFDAGGLAEGLVHGETGLVAPMGDEEALARHLVALLSDAERLARFSAAARAHVVERFDLRRQTRDLEKIYDQAREAYSGG